MQLEWIRAFLAVVDHGGFSAASVHLYRSQGRISSYIAALEREIGSQLFDRNQRPARLTAAGVAFLVHARAMLDDLDAGRAAIAAVQNVVRGDVTLATYPSAGAAFAPAVLSRFSADYPGVHVALVEQAVHGIDTALYEGPARLAIRPTLPPVRVAHSFGCALLWRERMCMVVPEDHPLATRHMASLADLRGEQLVVSGQHLRYDTEAFRLLEGRGIEPTVRFLSGQPQILVGLVHAGLAVGFTNRLALETVRTEGVVAVDISPSLYRDVAVYWSSDVAGSPAAAALLETIRATPSPEDTLDLRASSH